MNEQRDIGMNSKGGIRLGVGIVPLLSLLIIGSGCASNADKKVANAANGASTNGETGPSSPAQGTPQAGPASACPIDDMRDGDNRILTDAGRGGYWYSYVDSAGSSITPAAGTAFTMSPASAPNLPAFAARFSGNISNGQVLYAGIGFNLTQPKAAYDASRYTGVSFWAKAEAASTKNVRFKISDVNTDPDGKVCTGCYNDFGSDLVLTESWRQFVIRFADMTQLTGWGAPLVAHITPSAVFGMQWQLSSPGTSYDIAVSNLSFTGCP